MLPFADCFSPDYATARARFVEAAGRRGFDLQSHPISETGPDGGPLTVDVAAKGPADARGTVIVSSGLHGVEGFFGSAVQLAWLDRHDTLPPGTRVVLVHALNPYGFAHVRRWNEHNVDLNRNFVADFDALRADLDYAEALRVYTSVYTFLNPAAPPSPCEWYTFKAGWALYWHGLRSRGRLDPAQRPWACNTLGVVNVGRAQLQQSLPVGQYEYPQGLFYGGTEPEATTRLVRERLGGWAGGSANVVHIDLHTGLGRWAACALLLHEEQGSPAAAWAQSHFGDRVQPWSDGGTAYRARGTIGEGCGPLLAGREYHCLTAEFGTYPPERVLAALRAENAARFHARRDGRAWQRAKQRLREAFCPASPPWRERCVGTALEVVAQALAACGV